MSVQSQLVWLVVAVDASPSVVVAAICFFYCYSVGESNVLLVCLIDDE